MLISRGRIVADGSGPQIRALASGRTVRATVPGVDHGVTSAVAALGGVEHVDVRGESVTIHAKDSDAVARYLLTETAARDVEIVAQGIEEAFLTLTGETA